jgi:malate dehydrogenase
VGTNTAFFIAEKGIGDVMLYDIQEGLAKGKSLDMMEAAPIRKYRTKVQAADSIAQIHDADILVVAAGSVRTPGMSREDLFEVNLPIITNIALQLRHAPGVVVIATEPVDLVLPEFVRISCLSPLRVVGLGGILHSTRLRYMLSRELGVAAEDVVAQVIGRDSRTMMPLYSHCSVGGIPVELLLSPQQLAALTVELVDAGDHIVELAQRSSAYYAPSAAAADLCEAMVKNTGAIHSLSHVFQGAFGISGVAMSLPCRIGKNGIEQIMVPRLTQEQERQIQDSAKQLVSLAGR